MRLPGHPGALADAEGAADWYDEQEAGLGDQFLAALDETLELLQTFPGIGHCVAVPGDDRGFRRLALNRFPTRSSTSSATSRSWSPFPTTGSDQPAGPSGDE